PRIVLGHLGAPSGAVRARGTPGTGSADRTEGPRSSARALAKRAHSKLSALAKRAHSKLSALAKRAQSQHREREAFPAPERRAERLQLTGHRGRGAPTRLGGLQTRLRTPGVGLLAGL